MGNVEKKIEKSPRVLEDIFIENIKIWCGKCQKKWKKSLRVSEDIVLKT